MLHLKFPEDLLIVYLMLLRGQPCSPFKSVQISVNAEYTSVLNCVHFITLVWLCVCVCIFVWVEVVLSDKGMRLEPPGFIWAKQEGPVSVWAPLLSARGPQSHEQKVPPHISHLSSSQAGTNLSFYLSPSIHTGLFLSFFHYPVSSPLLSQAMAWPTFTSPTLYSLISTVLALSIDHVHVWKWPICSILSLFMNIHFTNINM